MTEKDEEICGEMMVTKGFGWRVSLSILMGVGWLVFLIIWLFFYAGGYNIYQRHRAYHWWRDYWKSRTSIKRKRRWRNSRQSLWTAGSHEKITGHWEYLFWNRIYILEYGEWDAVYHWQIRGWTSTSNDRRNRVQGKNCRGNYRRTENSDQIRTCQPL